MEIEFDPAKDVLNLAKHGVSLARAADFTSVHVEVDRRFDYTETRYRAFGWIDGLPHMLAFTYRGPVLRAISLRRSNITEFRRYVA